VFSLAEILKIFLSETLSITAIENVNTCFNMMTQ
jgi:hypothetical protein